MQADFCTRTTSDGRRASVRGGFTLIETLLVVAVLVGLAGISFATMGNFGESQRMRRVQDDLRGLVTGLRVRAMDEGQVYQLAYRPKTGDYMVRLASVQNPAEQREPLVGPIRTSGAALIGAHRLEDGMLFVEVVPTNADTVVAPTRPTDLESNGYVVHTFQPDGSTDDFVMGIVETTGFAAVVRVSGRSGRMVVEGPIQLTQPSIPMQGPLR